MYRLITLILFSLVILMSHSCATSSTDLVFRPTSLHENEPYAKVRPRLKDSTGSIVRASTQHPLKPSLWEDVVQADSNSKLILKTIYSITPYGIFTNLVHGKGGDTLLGVGPAMVTYLPAGKVHLLLFNQHKQRVAVSTSAGVLNQKQDTYTEVSFYYGTRLSAKLQAEKTYYLHTKVLDSNIEDFHKVNACVSLLDEDGNEAVYSYELLILEDLVETKIRDYTITRFDKLDLENNIDTAVASGIVGAQASKIGTDTMKDVLEFMTDVKEGRYDKEVSVKINILPSPEQQ